MIVNARFSDQLQGGEVRSIGGLGRVTRAAKGSTHLSSTYLPIYLPIYLLLIYLPIYQALILTHTCNQTIPNLNPNLTRLRRIRIHNPEFVRKGGYSCVTSQELLFLTPWAGKAKLKLHMEGETVNTGSHANHGTTAWDCNAIIDMVP